MSRASVSKKLEQPIPELSMDTPMAKPSSLSTGTDIVVAVTNDPGIVLLDTEKFDVWYKKLKAKAPTGVDVATTKGRAELRSYAAEVRSEKAAIDKARLRLTKEWRDMTAQANAAGKVIEERLESLAVEVRRPLTEWEDAEKARMEACRAVINGFHAARVVTTEDTADAVRSRGMEVYNIILDAERFGDLLAEAQQAKDDAVATLKRALDRLTQEEADKAELERLREEAAARAEADRIAAEKAEEDRREAARLAAEQKAADDAKAEAVRQAALAEQAEAERIERVKQEAAEAAQREAEEKAKREQEERDRTAQAEIDAANERARQAEAAAQAERDRITAEETARQAEAKRLADEQAKRDADQKHRTAVKAAAKTAIMSCGADEETARKIVMAIIAGEVPNVALRF